MAESVRGHGQKCNGGKVGSQRGRQSLMLYLYEYLGRELTTKNDLLICEWVTAVYVTVVPLKPFYDCE